MKKTTLFEMRERWGRWNAILSRITAHRAYRYNEHFEMQRHSAVLCRMARFVQTELADANTRYWNAMHASRPREALRVWGMPEDVLLNVFHAAMEGGVNYWADLQCYRWRAADGNESTRGFYATLASPDGDFEPIEVNAEVILRGIMAIARGDIRLNGCDGAADCCQRLAAGGACAEDACGDCDAELADTIVQAGLFGAVIYG